MKLGVRKLTDLEALVLLTSKIEFVLFFSKIYFIFHCILTIVQQVQVQQLKMYYVDCVLKSIVATRNVITTHNVINSHYTKVTFIVNILIFRTRICGQHLHYGSLYL